MSKLLQGVLVSVIILGSGYLVYSFVVSPTDTTEIAEVSDDTENIETLNLTETDYVDLILGKTLGEVKGALGEPTNYGTQWIRNGVSIRIDTKNENSPIHAVSIEFDHVDKELSSILDIAGITRPLPETVEHTPDPTRYPNTPFVDYSSWLWSFPNTHYGSVIILASKENKDDEVFSVKVDVETVEGSLINLADEVVTELDWYKEDNGSYPSTNNEWKSLGSDPELLEFTSISNGGKPYNELFKYKSDGSHYELTVPLPNLESKSCVWDGEYCLHKIQNGIISSLRETTIEEENFSFDVLGFWDRETVGGTGKLYEYTYSDENDTIGPGLNFSLSVIESYDAEALNSWLETFAADDKTFYALGLWTLKNKGAGNGYEITSETGICPRNDEIIRSAGEFSIICSGTYFFVVPENIYAPLNNGNSYIIWLYTSLGYLGGYDERGEYVGVELDEEVIEMIENQIVTIVNSFSVK